MENLHQDPHVAISYDQGRDIIIDVWSDKTQYLSEAEFKDLLLLWMSYVKKHDVKNAITDLVNFTFPMTPEIQGWTLQNITIPLSKNYNYSKHAFIMPSEFIANLAIEQFAEETNSVAAETKYFGDMTDARKWIEGK